MSVRISAEYASVRVPATSANLGPGFDSLGLAVRFYDEVDVRPVTYATHVDVEGVGAGNVPTDDNNLVVRALRFGLEAVGASQANFDMRCRNRVPHGSGMGSSASAAVAGLMLARGLIDEPEALTRSSCSWPLKWRVTPTMWLQLFTVAPRFPGWKRAKPTAPRSTSTPPCR